MGKSKPVTTEPLARASGSLEQSIEERRALSAKLDETVEPTAAPELTPEQVEELDADDAERPMSIAKPPAFDLSAYEVTHTASIGGVKTLLNALPHHRISEAQDYVRVHSNEEKYWSKSIAFVSVPIIGGRDQLHILAPTLAGLLPSAKVKWYRLALATKPHNKFFMCHVPTQNLDNAYNKSSLAAIEIAKQFWTEVVRREDGVDGYTTKYAENQDAFPDPEWPTQSLAELIGVTFDGRIIDTPDHAGWLRLIGARQSDV